MPSADLETLEDAHDHIARLRGAVDKLTEIIGTGTPVMVNTSFTAIDPVNGGPETWHPLGGVTGMTGPTAYALTAENETQIEIRLISAAGTTGGTYTFANALPKPYWPVNDILLDAITNDLSTNGTARPRVFVQAGTGTVQVIFATLTTGQQFQCHGCFPLDI